MNGLSCLEQRVQEGRQGQAARMARLWQALKAGLRTSGFRLYAKYPAFPLFHRTLVLGDVLRKEEREP